jgi:hypothetical protein
MFVTSHNKILTFFCFSAISWGCHNVTFSNSWQITDLQEEAMERALRKGLITEPLRMDSSLFRGFCILELDEFKGKG